MWGKSEGGSRVKWVTRKNANVDRIACPWLIKRFIDKDAEFLFVPAEEVAAGVKGEKAISHDGERGRLGPFVGSLRFVMVPVEDSMLTHALSPPPTAS